MLAVNLLVMEGCLLRTLAFMSDLRCHLQSIHSDNYKELEMKQQEEADKRTKKVR